MAKRRCQVLCGLPRRLPGRQLRAYGEGGYCVSMTMSNASHEGFSRFVAATGRSLQRYVRRLVGSPAAAEDIMPVAYVRTYQQGDRVEHQKDRTSAVTVNRVSVSLIFVGG